MLRNARLFREVLIWPKRTNISKELFCFFFPKYERQDALIPS